MVERVIKEGIVVAGDTFHKIRIRPCPPPGHAERSARVEAF
jgi:hypothetical protein